ncbi:hypothetical protein [Parvicella tangerina]|uniref:Uncharacterized protein n=1 Tax=Parvicella tangerina TaxID=2829795 RepID=A0A916JPI8_9FLAO|nr:hypothetical protein [Parvicella tangerina]CAG5084222.1 hypothetical protein CRYO30217_02409 [Parvicella tangerina]
MRKKLVIFTLTLGCALILNSCFLFGGGKSKCGDCPTWSQNDQELEQEEVVERERV